MKILTVLIILILSASQAPGSLSIPIIEDEEDLYDLLTIGEITYSQYLDLLSLLRRGVDINTDEIMELAKIPGLSEIDLLRIKEARRERGYPFKQVEELNEIPGLDEEAYLRLLPFVRVIPERPEIFNGSLKLKACETLDDGKTAEFYGQSRLYYGRHSEAYIAMEKDEGEEEFETRYRCLKFKDLGPIKEMSIGDYKAYFGERLVIGHSFDGAMSHFRIARCEQAFIYSYPAAGERLFGANCDLPFGARGKIGIGWLTYGERNVYGVHLRIPVRDIEVFSEWASLNGGGTGLIVGADLDLRSIGILASYRRYDQDFTNPYSDGFEGDDDRDEEGIYLELKLSVPKWKVVGFFNGWQHLSNLISDSEKGLKLSYDLSAKARFRLLREYRDEDIDSAGGTRTKTSIEAVLHPLTKVKTSLYVRSTERDVSTSPDSEVDVYARLKLAYEISQSLELEAGTRLNATDIYGQGNSSTGFYLQWRDQLNDHLSFVSRYTNTAYNYSHKPSNPEHEFKFQVDVDW